MIEPTLNFSRTEFAQRLHKTRQAMERLGIDLLVVSDPSNMNWLTGYDGWSFYVHQCVLMPKTVSLSGTDEGKTPRAPTAPPI